LKKRRKRFALYLVLAGLAIFVLTGADSCTSQAINQNSKSDAQVQKAMTTVQLGMSEPEVRSILGEPNDTQEMNTDGYQNDCWYYGSTNSWQLCFDNGLMERHEKTLTSKNHY
jgi:outer membrane protein assembly factor BamE (lipoprotein component of BamABCDE complex)